MASLSTWARGLTRISPSTPLRFPAAGFEIINDADVEEEEQFDAFRAGQCYLVNLGDVYASKYQITGKLGFGTTSTVWLARNLEGGREEFETYGHFSQANPSHPGYRHVRSALDTFSLHRTGGDYRCLVQKPMWDSWRDLLRRNPTQRFSLLLPKVGLKHVLLALDYLHNECQLAHTGTDIKANNLLQEIVEDRILEDFVKTELKTPSLRKFIERHPVYRSRQFGLPTAFGGALLSDFGTAVRGDQKRNHDAQPNVYWSPEVMLSAEQSLPIRDLFEGKHPF
ncbi:uncharacterized protein J7T54_003222 [Emericellopsis cladophorae]|uniref:non-specific serine/threonine protein kinase n=1 Tax=Emericellopsis cladophorae TaxID=2686198 RepID=A0A9Q0BDY5_9HYPO|nr:uncharacterized protein J7T54_003222 [Emericellopsis cladophorae]KAI6781055.1 hypothetical protein J7T54_003222 [Emericellopsis cladophorae]